MTDDEREALIERIKAVRDDGYLSATYLGNEHVGDLMGDILAMFEQAHTATDDERELIEELRRCAQESASGSHAGNSPLLRGADLATRAADALARRTVQGEPSDDEREALISLSVQWTGDHAYLADAILADGFRRSEVQGPSAEEKDAGLSDAHSESYRQGWRAGRASAHSEPQGEPRQHIVPCARCGKHPVVASDAINSDIVLCDRCAFVEGRESVEPQGEPTDAEVDAAGPLLYGNWPLIREFVFEHVRAALRAAAEVRDER